MPLALPDTRFMEALPQTNKEATLFVQRDDLIDPWLGGNKAYKLLGNLHAFNRSAKKAILTFGGAWSNHLVATAAMCRWEGIPAAAIVRGDSFVTNPRLEFLRSCGMQLIFSERSTYRLKEDAAVRNDYIHQAAAALSVDPAELFCIPEGGASHDGFLACQRVLDASSQRFTHVLLACGTGTTLAGVAAGLAAGQQAIGIAVVNDLENIRKRIREFGAPEDRLLLNGEFTFGGYAKTSPELMDFCQRFTSDTGIPIEPVYTGKAFFAAYRLMETGFFPKGSAVLILHSGGIYPCDNAESGKTGLGRAVSNL